MFVLSLKYGNDDPTRDYFGECYIPLVEMNDFNALFDSNSFFDQKVKSKQEVYGKLHCQEKMIIQQEVHQIICVIQNITNLLTDTYQDNNHHWKAATKCSKLFFQQNIVTNGT